MKDVAAEADVALGTVYRYFQSKDHLFAEVLAEWASHLRTNVERRPLRGATNAERLTDVLHRSMRAFQGWPQLARVVMALSLRGPLHPGYLRPQHGPQHRIYIEAMHGPARGGRPGRRSGRRLSVRPPAPAVGRRGPVDRRGLRPYRPGGMGLAEFSERLPATSVT